VAAGGHYRAGDQASGERNTDLAARRARIGFSNTAVLSTDNSESTARVGARVRAGQPRVRWTGRSLGCFFFFFANGELVACNCDQLPSGALERASMGIHSGQKPRTRAATAKQCILTVGETYSVAFGS